MVAWLVASKVLVELGRWNQRACDIRTYLIRLAPLHLPFYILSLYELLLFWNWLLGWSLLFTFVLNCISWVKRYRFVWDGVSLNLKRHTNIWPTNLVTVLCAYNHWVKITKRINLTKMAQVYDLCATLLFYLQVFEEFCVAIINKHLASNRSILSLSLVID